MYLHQCVLLLAVDAHQHDTSQGPVRSLSANHDVRVSEKNPMKYLNTVHGGGREGGGRSKFPGGGGGGGGMPQSTPHCACTSHPEIVNISLLPPSTIFLNEPLHVLTLLTLWPAFPSRSCAAHSLISAGKK